MKQIPEHLILRLKEDKQIEQCARLEAEMTFMKSKMRETAAEVIYIYPEYVKSREDLFLFAMTFGRHLTELNFDLRKVSKQVEGIFKDAKNRT